MVFLTFLQNLFPWFLNCKYSANLRFRRNALKLNFAKKTSSSVLQLTPTDAFLKFISKQNKKLVSRQNIFFFVFKIYFRIAKESLNLQMADGYFQYFFQIQGKT